ncbi:hypothetical protein [Haliangium ochraceum]|uniref:Lipoprotein n=1 Tax=Haliangium ochraceum (strain DSM 14365 / JCM 11303 / SMP-2) TaxID=502025 RepID=D0LV85_HALO1|nr:hypothetical protein [Haliangium ochraceum]ACY15926.1 hypothetical protein Hoch_3424 [Haliangium ochraceum DSM 14365]
MNSLIHMFRRPLLALPLSLALSASACVQEEGPGEPPAGEVDQTRLAEFRSALPTADQLGAPEVQADSKALALASQSDKALGDLAMYPQSSYEIVISINGAVTGIIETLDEIVAQPPTIFDSSSQEYLWGPYPNEEGVGYVAAYIRDAGEDEDFRYQYALLRGADTDVERMVPVIWGGASPDAENEDFGAGITLWDFEANYAFLEANAPELADEPLDRGRFAALYASGPDEQDPSATSHFVLASFRDFVAADDPSAEPTDFDYFYGHYDGELTVDFLDWEAAFDITDEPDGIAEDIGVRMAFVNGGVGRAEADVRGGSLADGQTANAIECWDATVRETYLRFEILTGDTQDALIEVGELDNCGDFSSSLDELGVPSLDDIDGELRAALDQVASTGAPVE